MTELERDTLRLFHLRLSLADAGRPEVESRARRQLRIPDDPRIDAHVALGKAEFDRLVIGRVLREHGDQVVLNRCPRCRRLPRTPRARQCPWCMHDWH